MHIPGYYELGALPSDLRKVLSKIDRNDATPGSSSLQKINAQSIDYPGKSLRADHSQLVEWMDHTLTENRIPENIWSNRDPVNPLRAGKGFASVKEPPTFTTRPFLSSSDNAVFYGAGAWLVDQPIKDVLVRECGDDVEFLEIILPEPGNAIFFMDCVNTTNRLDLVSSPARWSYIERLDKFAITHCPNPVFTSERNKSSKIFRDVHLGDRLFITTDLSEALEECGLRGAVLRPIPLNIKRSLFSL